MRSPEANKVWQEFSSFCEENGLDDNYNEFLHYGEDNYLQRRIAELNLVSPFEFKHVEQGGCWNDGGTITNVVKIGDFFFKDEGTYSSWDSSFWENHWNEVHPVEVTIIEYR